MQPTEGEILYRLRELRRLPERPDFRAWKQDRLKLFERLDTHPEELWHLPGGKTLRVISQPHPFGGLLFLYEDVSDQLRLESSYNTLIKVQKATLDTLQEGVAVFGPDGKLKLHNAAFARIWRLEPTELAGEPHLQHIAEACATRFGRDRVWEIVTSTGDRGRTRTAARMGRGGTLGWGDHFAFSCTAARRGDARHVRGWDRPLPDRVRRCASVTRRWKRRQAQIGIRQAPVVRAPDAAEFDHGLRPELHTARTRALNKKQGEYADAIVSGVEGLRDLINDILDLSTSRRAR